MRLKMPDIMLRAIAAVLPAALALLSVSSCQKQEALHYSPEDLELEMLIKDYLEADYSSSIGNVTVTPDKVTVSGHYSGSGKFYVAEIPPYMDLLRLDEPLSVFRPDEASFSFETARHVETEGGISYDRLLSKYLDMAPTLIVKPAYRFTVIVNKELLLPVRASL